MHGNFGLAGSESIQRTFAQTKCSFNVLQIPQNYLHKCMLFASADYCERQAIARRNVFAFEEDSWNLWRSPVPLKPGVAEEITIEQPFIVNLSYEHNRCRSFPSITKTTLPGRARSGHVCNTAAVRLDPTWQRALAELCLFSLRKCNFQNLAEFARFAKNCKILARSNFEKMNFRSKVCIPGGSVHGERANFKRLVLGYIKATFWKQILMWKLSPRSTHYTPLHHFV